MASQQTHGGDGKRVTDPPDSTESKPDVTEKYKGGLLRLREAPSNHNGALLYLYQTQDEDFVRRTMTHMPHLSMNHSCPELNLMDKAVSYCLEKSELNHCITFRHYYMSSESLRILSPGLLKCSEISFQDCDLKPDFIEDLRYRSMRDSSLGASQNIPQSSRLKTLCDILRHPDCILQALELRRCNLTSSCCEDLSSVIITNRSLTKLDLSDNNLRDSGVKRLCEGLQQRDCKLQVLRLRCCGLTSFCFEDLRSVITNRSLITLDLSHNNLPGSRIKNLYEDLRHPDCVLQDLWLEHCNLTESFCEELHCLIDDRICLHLEGNNLGVSGIKRPGEDPRLWNFNHTPFRFDTRRSSTTTNRDLTKQDLSYTRLEGLTIMHLFKDLTHPRCFVQELRLQLCGLTSSCCEALRYVLISNRSLMKLDLSLNDLQDSGVKHLCEGFGHPDCILKELRLERCGLTSSCREDLRSAMITNRSLIKLDLSHNDLQDSGVKRLCEGLRRPDCILQELRLCHCNLSFSGIEELLRTANRSLAKLDLSYNMSATGITRQRRSFSY